MAQLARWTSLDARSLPQIKATAQLFRHDRSGAQVLSIQLAHATPCFGITFRTPPSDSTGAAHVLEHMVFAGSRKYPLKDTLTYILQRSLKVWLSATTYPDRTCYLAASHHPSDLRNLVDFCLDSVLYPRLSPEAFQQQAWRYELATPQEPLTYQGVVLNEMKGRYSTSEHLLKQTMQRALFPDTIYRFDAGGAPETIPALSYHQLLNVHRRFYRPANALIFFAGDDDPTARLALLDEYLAALPDSAADWSIPLQPRFHEPRRLSTPGIWGQRSAQIALGWMLDQTVDVEAALALRVLAQILTGTPDAPLRCALSDTRSGLHVFHSGINETLRQMTYVVGVTSTSSDRAAHIEQLALDRLEQLVHDGIDPTMVHAALNTIEFRLREQRAHSLPHGLTLLLRALPNWTYGGDPIAPLLLDAPLATLKARVQAGEPVFEQLIERWLLRNPHRVTVTLEPATTDPAAAEQERLAHIKAALQPAALGELVAQAEALKRYLAAPDPPVTPALLPSITRADLQRHIASAPFEQMLWRGTRLLHHNIATDGIVYLDLGFDLHYLPADLLGYLPVLLRALVSRRLHATGAAELSQRLSLLTGGIRPEFLTASGSSDGRGITWAFLRCKALVEQLPQLLTLVHEMLLTDLDRPAQICHLVRSEQAAREQALPKAGHRFVQTRLRSAYSEADWLDEHVAGISSLWFLRDLLRLIETDWPTVHTRLEQLRSMLLNRAIMLCNVTVDHRSWSQLTPHLEHFLDHLPARPAELHLWRRPSTPPAEGLAMPTPLNFVGKAANIYHLGNQRRGVAVVANHYLDNTWIWNMIRSQGGAYGALSTFDPRSGTLCYLSLHDPHLTATLATFDQTATFLRAVSLSQAELQATVIGAVGAPSASDLPDQQAFRAMQRHLVGETDAQRQQLLDDILATSVADLRAFADTLDQVAQHGRVLVIGAEAALEAAAKVRGGCLQIRSLV